MALPILDVWKAAVKAWLTRFHRNCSISCRPKIYVRLHPKTDDDDYQIQLTHASSVVQIKPNDTSTQHAIKTAQNQCRSAILISSMSSFNIQLLWYELLCNPHNEQCVCRDNTKQINLPLSSSHEYFKTNAIKIQGKEEWELVATKFIVITTLHYFQHIKS